MVDAVRVDELDPTILPSRTHVVPAMKDGLTVKLSVDQILELAEKEDVGLGNADNTSDADKPISDAQAAALAKRVPVDAAVSFTPEEQAQAQENLGIADGWANLPVGVPVPVQDNLDSSLAPPIDDDRYRYIKLTAGLTGSGAYNEGVLTSESVSESAPLVVATAQISDAGSILNGKTVSLINTENSSLRASTSPGTKQNDQGQSITGSISIRRANTTSTSTTFGSTGAISQSEDSVNTGLILGFVSPTVSAPTDRITFNNANSPGARVGNETRSKNIGVTYYMRIR